MGVVASAGKIDTGTLGNIVINLPFTPKFFAMFGFGPIGAPNTNMYMSKGWSDGTSQFYYQFFVRQTNNNFGGAGYTKIFEGESPPSWDYTFVSFNAASVTINGVTSTAGESIGWIALGDDVESDIHTISTGAGLGNITKTGLAFEPNLLLSLFGGGATGFGFGATNDTDEACIFSYMPDGAVGGTNTRQTDQWFISDALNGADIHNILLSAFNADGYTLAKTTNGTTNNMYMAALKVPSSVIGVGLQPAVNGIQTIITGIKPRLIILFSWSNRAEVFAGELINNVKRSFGAASDPSDQFSVMLALFKDPPTATRANRRFSDSTILNMIDANIGVTGDILATAELDAIGNNSFDLNWTLTDATARQFVYLVIGDPVLVTTDTVINIGSTTAESGGTVSSDGAPVISQRGVCWSTSTNPTTADSTTSDGTGLGAFTSNLTGLTPATTYYVRAYAISDGITYYGDEETFMTLAAPVDEGGLLMFGVGN